MNPMDPKMGRAALLVLLAGVSASSARAQCDVQTVRTNNPFQPSYFARDVAIDGTTAVIGADAACNLPGCTPSGGAFVYDLGPQGWSQSALLLPSAGVTNDESGRSVDISGHTIVMGSFNSSPGGQALAGSAYVFERIAGVWTETQRLFASDLRADARFGWDVAIDGDRIVVGAYLDSEFTFGGGAVYVFDRQGGSFVETAKLVTNDLQDFDAVGWSVDVSGDTAVTGAVGADGCFGAAYVFQLVGGFWNQTQKLAPAELQYLDVFGGDVSLEGDRLAVGAPHQRGTEFLEGSVYIYERTGSNFTNTAVLRSPHPTMGGMFGSSVALDGSRVAVGAELEPNLLGQTAGAAYVFDLSSAGWAAVASLSDIEGDHADSLGHAISISGDHVLVGEPFHVYPIPDDLTQTEAGQAWFFDVPSFASGYCFGSACPCGNDAAVRGCVNSTGFGALLVGCGSGSVGADDARFEATLLPPGQPTLLFRAANALHGGSGVPFGDGLRCAGGGALRIGVAFADAAGTADWGPGLAPAAGWLPGETWRLQAWYRDPQGSPCGNGFNTTNGVEALFAP